MVRTPSPPLPSPPTSIEVLEHTVGEDRQLLDRTLLIAGPMQKKTPLWRKNDDRSVSTAATKLPHLRITTNKTRETTHREDSWRVGIKRYLKQNDIRFFVPRIG